MAKEQKKKPLRPRPPLCHIQEKAMGEWGHKDRAKKKNGLHGTTPGSSSLYVHWELEEEKMKQSWRRK